MDVLSDVLLAVRLTGAVFFDVDARSPFATETPNAAAIGDQVLPNAAAIGDQVLPGAQHVISFHLVTEGSCWAETIDRTDSPVQLQVGDMVVFPGGDGNIMASAPGMRGKPVPAQYYRPADQVLPFSLKMTREPDADRTRFVCGFLGCDVRPFNPLLEALPYIVHAPVSEERADSGLRVSSPLRPSPTTKAPGERP
jgi:Cupin